MIPKKILVIILLFVLLFSSADAAMLHSGMADTSFICDTMQHADSVDIFVETQSEQMTLAIRDSVKSSKFKTKKLVAAILAFPVPFGLLGLHRVFLGTKPYIPFVYIGTLGGCFLILPIIDFVTILSSKEEDLMRFENNPKVFMWSQ